MRDTDKDEPTRTGDHSSLTCSGDVPRRPTVPSVGTFMGTFVGTLPTQHFGMTPYRTTSTGGTPW
jgi:hypothetical protein